ncbi:hypothetical protein F5887DRAFT_1189878 [Amanita rubescens]|nr:hypothetical protein F5887DRAFT_1189878 [Amanita rubescens]
MSTGPSYEMRFPWSSTRKCTPETSSLIARYTVIETNTEIIKLRAESEREEAFKVLLASITEFKCGISAKSAAKYNVVETSFKKARQEIAEKETLVGVERQPFISFERTSVPSSVSETSKHGSSDILQPSRFEFAFREKANVGSLLSKMFVKYVVDGMLTSPGGEAKEALEWNAVCSYWMSSRDRIMNQMEGGGRKLCFEDKDKWGIILPQVITMGTVTRSAIEKAWLKASNAKKNRVGSGWSVHHPATQSPVPMSIRKSSSCMGDAQFGAKSAGTDLHSKTAKILGLSPATLNY